MRTLINYISIIVLLAIVVIIGSLWYYLFSKNLLRTRTFIFALIFVVFLSFSLSKVLNSIEASQHTPEMDQIVFEGTLDIKLIEQTDRTYLAFTENNKEVEYISVYTSKPFIAKKVNPIYLEDIGDYYVMIYSKDKNKEIINNRFLQGDYEFYDSDHLVLIQKSTGYIFDTQDYELIGREIDLSSFQYSGTTIFYSVFLPYENGISFVQYISVSEDYSIETRMDKFENYSTNKIFGDSTGLVHSHTFGDPSKIVDFIVTGNYIYIKDSYNVVTVASYVQDTYGLNFTYDDSLSEEEFVLEGFIDVTIDGIYYLSSNYNIYRLIPGFLNATLIEENVTKDEYLTYDFN